MEEITFKDWRIGASIVDSDVLKLDIEALDGTDIIEVGYGGHSAGRGGEPFALRFTSEKIEEAHNRPVRQGSYNPSEAEAETDETHGDWPADEDETLYVHGWEVTAFVDEEGILNVDVEKGEDNAIYEEEPLESGTPLSARVSIRLAAEETDEDNEEEEDEEDDFDEDLDDFDDLNELGEADDGEDDYADEFEEVESFSPYDDFYERPRDEDWY